MKVVLLLLFLGAASAFERQVSYEENLLRNSIDELVRKTFEYARWLLKRHEPYPVPALPEMRLVDDDVDVTFSTSDLKISKATNFVIDKISNNLPKLLAVFGVTLPSAQLAGNYKVTGTAFKKAISGTGTFTVQLTNAVPTGTIQFGIVDHSLQIKDLKVDYQLGEAHFDEEGLAIEGMTSAQVKEWLNTQLVNNINKNKAFYCEKAANHITEIANNLLKGHSLTDVLDFLKKLVVSTPDPPPFPTLAP